MKSEIAKKLINDCMGYWVFIFFIPARELNEIIYADKDKPSVSQKAARDLRLRLKSLSYTVKVLFPSADIPDGKSVIDWIVEDIFK